MRLFSSLSKDDSDWKLVSADEKKETDMRYKEISKLIHQDLRGFWQLVLKEKFERNGLLPRKEVHAPVGVSVNSKVPAQFLVYSNNGNTPILLANPSRSKIRGAGFLEEIQTQHHKYSAKVGFLAEENEIGAHATQIQGSVKSLALDEAAVSAVQQKTKARRARFCNIN